VAAPAGFYESDPETAFELASAGRYAGDPVGGAGFTESDLRAKLADMKRAGALLIPRPFAASIGKATPGDTPHTGWVITSRAHDYWALTLFPLTFYEKNPEPNLGGLLAAAIKQGYRRAESRSPDAG